MTPGALRIASLDLETSKAFYEDQVGLKKVGGSTEDGYLVFDISCLQLVIEPADDEITPRFVALSFAVQDLEIARARLESKGVKFHGPSAIQTWGGLLAHFEDPSGELLTLTQYPT